MGDYITGEILETAEKFATDLWGKRDQLGVADIMIYSLVCSPAVAALAQKEEKIAFKTAKVMVLYTPKQGIAPETLTNHCMAGLEPMLKEAVCSQLALSCLDLCFFSDDLYQGRVLAEDPYTDYWNAFRQGLLWGGHSFSAKAETRYKVSLRNILNSTGFFRHIIPQQPAGKATRRLSA